MGDLTADDGIFIRSMASRGSTGGLCRAARMAMDVMEAFGKDVVLVETVGVGQSEVDVLDAVDTSVVVLMPQIGDNIQVMKAGLMEIADVFVVNKSDLTGAEDFLADVDALLDMNRSQGPGAWRPPAVKTCASRGVGIEEVSAGLARHRAFLEEHGLMAEKRKKRLHKEIRELFIEDLMHRVMDGFDADARIAEAVERVVSRHSDPLAEMDSLINGILKPLAK